MTCVVGRGPRYPPTRELGQHPARDRTLPRRAARPDRARGARGRDPDPRRFGLLAREDLRAPGGGWDPLLDRGAGRRRADEEWTKLEDYPEPGLAEIAETTYGGRRLVVRRVREFSDQQQLLPGWRHHPFITNRDEEIEVVEAKHRRHAVVELAIRDLRPGPWPTSPRGTSRPTRPGPSSPRSPTTSPAGARRSAHRVPRRGCSRPSDGVCWPSPGG